MIEAHKIQVQASRFSLVNRQLYKWSLDEPYLKCLTPQQGQYILAELHEGICGNHPSIRTLAHMAHTQGYYWLTMRVDTVALRQEVRPLPTTSPHLKGTGLGSYHHHKPFTLCSTGDRYNWIVTYRPSLEEVIVGCHRLF